MQRTVNQYLNVSCYVDLYDLDKLMETLVKVNEILNSNKWMAPWLEAEIDDNVIHIFGETEIETVLIPGCPGSRWEPPEPAYFEDMITQDELKLEIKNVVNQVTHDYEIDFDDIHVDSTEELMDKMWSEV